MRNKQLSIAINYPVLIIDNDVTNLVHSINMSQFIIFTGEMGSGLYILFKPFNIGLIIRGKVQNAAPPNYFC